MIYLLVDTDILIDIANDDITAQTRLSNEAKNAVLSVSVITVMELIVGCRNKSELQVLSSFLIQFHVLTLNQEISGLGIDLIKKYYLSHGLLIPDALIAATAMGYNIGLLSKNQRDYCFIESLNLLPYP
ncbi:type II toxin-antitoxin system VapC family toxin [Crocosphaera sp. UHCC 0190]|uniref:type II toxin-antitoxin system VapC family toxin n=1 Tax=Crocosphaera sp. UHCC 0190 TaxID=3110246 RepID=UPI002B20272A|nr:type II toxin-antitoxin system VapC family toxin [Crocosphaera sp. UHCC 0190]MEA5511226.1 type II toxin-antitoxin system VapC family toxin [Crocosphaera sp. UHCC 0190]